MRRHSAPPWRKRRAGLVALAAVAILGLPGEAAAQEDTTPPELEALSCSPSAVDVTAAPQTVTCTATITDDVSGVWFGDVRLQSPSGIHSARSNFSHTSGDEFEAQLHIPRFVEAGTWRPASVAVFDNAGNQRSYSNTELQAMGIDVTVEVTSTPDTTAPELEALSCSPSAVDVTAAPQTVTCTATITDDVSGVWFGDVRLQSPSGIHSARSNFSHTSGDEFEAQLHIPRFVEAGTWRPASVAVFDNAGNQRSYSNTELQAMGIDVTVEVTSTPDTTAPELEALSCSPSAVDVTAAPQTVTCTATITDDVSGVWFGDVRLQSPSGIHSARSNFSHTSGDEFEAQLHIPRFVEAGTWRPASVAVFDNAGNQRSYSNTELQAMGIDVTVEVTNSSADVSVTQTDSPDPVAAGGEVAYTATVANDGPDDATSVELTDTLPVGATFVSATPDQGSCSEAGGTVTCDLGTIAASAGAEVEVRVDAPGTTGTITNTADVSAAQDDPDAGNNSSEETTAIAAPPPDWSAPLDLSDAGQDAFQPQVAVDADGDAVFTWIRSDGANYRVQAQARAADGTLSPVQTLSGAGQTTADPQVAIDADGDAVVTWRRFDGANWRVQARARAADGTLSAVQTLSGAGQTTLDPKVAIDADGDAVVTWRRFDGANWRVQARARAADGTLSPTKTLSGAGQDAFYPQVAIDADGDAVVTWFRYDGANYRVQARARAADGTLSPTKTLSGAGQDAFDPQVAIDADGDAVFAWFRHDGANLRVQARARAADGTLSATKTLSGAGQDAYGPQVAIDADGDAVFTWYRNWRVQARARSAAGTLSAVQTLSDAGQDAFYPQVAIDADGDAVFTWFRFDGANYRVQARARAADGTLSAVQTLSGAGQDAVIAIDQPQVAIDADGDAVVTWSRSDGANSRVQAAFGP